MELPTEQPLSPSAREHMRDGKDDYPAVQRSLGSPIKTGCFVSASEKCFLRVVRKSETNRPVAICHMRGLRDRIQRAEVNVR